MNNNAYALKNAILYTVLITLILLAPLYLYTVYMRNIHDTKSEIKLREKAGFIIRAMEDFSKSNKEVFTYPRYLPFESGLYDNNFQPVFTIIKEPLQTFMPGFNIHKGTAFFILKLPEKRYFNASYLVITSKISYLEIYQKVALVLLIIVSIIFFLSILFLQRFALPFTRVNKQLDNFIKDTMHEINTPLAIINVNIDLFTMHHQENKYLKRIKAATKTLANVYNDMDFLIKNKKILFVDETINLSNFVKDRIEYFSEVAALKDIEITHEIEEDIFIHFNSSQLQRIVDNNLSNAIKYSYEHNIIKVHLQKNPDHTCILCFKDYGIGIQDTKQIFSRYYREEREKGGFGIGLNIVKSIIDEADITLEVQSKLKEGSRFIYTFPSKMLIV